MPNGRDVGYQLNHAIDTSVYESYVDSIVRDYTNGDIASNGGAVPPGQNVVHTEETVNEDRRSITEKVSDVENRLKAMELKIHHICNDLGYLVRWVELQNSQRTTYVPFDRAVMVDTDIHTDTNRNGIPFRY